MAYSIILHLPNEEPILAEMDEMPKSSDTNIIVNNLRKRDGGRVAYLDAEAEKIVFPWHRVAFIEILPSDAEREKLVKFFRE